jgi:phosphoglycolate phosphatase-like HAD superfamily hydrolase
MIAQPSKIEGVLALDFDGVLWDSVDECREIGVRAWEAMGKAPLSIENLPARFRQGRPFCRTGYDFFIVLYLLREDPSIDFLTLDPEEFKSRRALLAEEAARFDRIFYDLRRHVRDKDFATWSSWQGPVSDALQAALNLRDRFRSVVIATTKDSESVRRLLATAGVELPITGREVTRDKGDQVRRIADESGLPVHRLFLVDDLLENLRMAQRAGARCALSEWGHNTPRDRALAESRGFPIIRRSSIEGDILALAARR